MAEYADVVAVSAAILQRTGMPAIVQEFWTEHSERSVLPTGLGVLGVSGPEKDLLKRWKPEGSDTYARSYGGRVAKLQLKFAVAARDENRYHVLDEREVGSFLLGLAKGPPLTSGGDGGESSRISGGLARSRSTRHRR